MKGKKKTVLIIILIISLILTLLGIILIINKELKVIDWISTIFTFAGLAMGYGISYLMNKIAVNTNKKRIFLSYSLNDRDFAKKLSTYFTSQKFIVFDENNLILPGDVVDKKINDYLNQSDIFIIIISKSTYKSKILKKEIELAGGRKKIIIPLLKENTDIPNYLNKYKIADFRTDHNTALKNLMKSL